MIENAVKNIQELNQVAGYLRKSQEFDRIRKLAYTWLVPEEYAEDFIAGKRCLLADADIEEKALTIAAVKAQLEGKTIRKVLVIKGRVVNIVAN